jgi:hypothetical protein
MKKWLRFLPVALVLGYVGVVWAQTNNTYTCLSTTISSSSSPVAVATPGRMTTWIAHVRSTPAADPVLIFPYTGTVPTAVPSPAAAMEIPSGSYLPDAVTCPAPTCLDAMGQGWAAVLLSGSTSTVVDWCSR